MQAIAEENNPAETAFIVPSDGSYQIRWFTPNKEVKLCGHATLASAYVLFNILGCKEEVLSFESLSGELLVSKVGNLLTLDFPAQPPVKCNTPTSLIRGVVLTSFECLKYDDYVAVFENEEDVLSITPIHESLKELDLRGVIATAPSSKFDFIVRFFAPKFGVPEDSVTGSAYTQLMPYWSDKLSKATLHAKQVSERGGKLTCELRDNRVLISGSAVTYMEGSIEIKT